MENETKYCHNCGAEIDGRAVICPRCGVQQAKTVSSSKNEGLAAVLSFFVTGAGQIYNGQIVKGILLFVIQVVNWVLCAIGVGVILLIIVWIYGIYDAYNTARSLNDPSLSRI